LQAAFFVPLAIGYVLTSAFLLFAGVQLLRSLAAQDGAPVKVMAGYLLMMSMSMLMVLSAVVMISTKAWFGSVEAYFLTVSLWFFGNYSSSLLHMFVFTAKERKGAGSRSGSPKTGSTGSQSNSQSNRQSNSQTGIRASSSVTPFTITSVPPPSSSGDETFLERGNWELAEKNRLKDEEIDWLHLAAEKDLAIVDLAMEEISELESQNAKLEEAMVLLREEIDEADADKRELKEKIVLLREEMNWDRNGMYGDGW
jgi:hypothetical protein